MLDKLAGGGGDNFCQVPAHIREKVNNRFHEEALKTVGKKPDNAEEKVVLKRNFNLCQRFQGLLVDGTELRRYYYVAEATIEQKKKPVTAK